MSLLLNIKKHCFPVTESITLLYIKHYYSFYFGPQLRQSQYSPHTAPTLVKVDWILNVFTANISCKFRWQKEHSSSPSWLNVQDRLFHLLSFPKNAPVCARVTTAGWPGPAAATGVTATATTTLQSPAGSRRGPWRPSSPSSASGGRRTGSTPPRSSRLTSEPAPSQSLIASI